MVFLLVKRVNKRSIALRPKVLTSERYIGPEKRIRVRLGSRHTAQTKTHAFKRVPRYGTINRTEIPFGLFPTGRGLGREELREQGVAEHDERIEFGRSLKLLHQIIYGGFIKRERLWPERVPQPRCDTYASRIIHLVGCCHVGENALVDIRLRIHLFVELHLAREQTSFALDDIKLGIRIRPIRSP